MPRPAVQPRQAAAAAAVPRSAAAMPARLHIKVQPGASREGCAGMHGDRLKVRLRAPAVDGKANAALLEWLSAELGVPERCLTISAGAKSRDKTIEIAGMDSAALAAWVHKNAPKASSSAGSSDLEVTVP